MTDRPGYTLPVFAAAAAKAALLRLGGAESVAAVDLVLDPAIAGSEGDRPDRAPRESPAEAAIAPDRATVPVEQAVRLDEHSALAIVRSDPGDNLDLTRNTPIWAWVRLEPLDSQDSPKSPDLATSIGSSGSSGSSESSQSSESRAPADKPSESSAPADRPASPPDRAGSRLLLEGGEGIGRTAAGKPAIYRYARELCAANLADLVPPGQRAIARFLLPEGRSLAKRTSNEAFGILDGLSLLGTSGIAEAHTSEDRLNASRSQLQAVLAADPNAILCIGSNGAQVADRLGLPAAATVLAGNWLGALLVEAGLRGAASVLLVGYHGKLVKLAGGIFNTSSHVADGRLEILAAAAVRAGGDGDLARSLLAADTVAEAQRLLVRAGRAEATFAAVAAAASQRSRAYIRKFADRELLVGTVLFDRRGQVVARDEAAIALLAARGLGDG